jgi:hypothetical protein
MGSWNIVNHPGSDLDLDPDPESHVIDRGWGGEGQMREPGREMPWEERGRYNVYEPASAEEEEWDEEDGEDVPLAILRNRVGHA